MRANRSPAMPLMGLFLAAAAFPAAAADPAAIDWSRIPETKVDLFYPGQSSYEWLRRDHAKSKGAKAVEGGQACVRCHDGDEKIMGESIVKGGALEPSPIQGKSGYKPLAVKAAYDAQNAYLWFQWRTDGRRAGSWYPYYRFDGKEWKVYGYPRLDPVVREGKQPGLYEDRLSLMIDDGKVPGFDRQGCWLSCHDGQRDMSGEASKDQAQAAMKKNDIRKYLPLSRTDPMDWRTVKPADALGAVMKGGGFLDLVQWRAHRSNPVGAADDGFVLEYRNFDAGKNVFASNLDDKKVPKYMFDARVFGANAARAEDIGKKDHFLIKGKNAVAFDPGAGWTAGDLLPRYVLQPGDASGSAADNKGNGKWENGTWTVVIVRPLGLPNGDDKAFRDGGVYSVAFAVHDDNVTTRGHQISFPKKLGFGVDADIRAVKLP